MTAVQINVAVKSWRHRKEYYCGVKTDGALEAQAAAIFWTVWPNNRQGPVNIVWLKQPANLPFQ